MLIIWLVNAVNFNNYILNSISKVEQITTKKRDQPFIYSSAISIASDVRIYQVVR
jgi:hypothetical protein